MAAGRRSRSASRERAAAAGKGVDLTAAAVEKPVEPQDPFDAAGDDEVPESELEARISASLPRTVMEIGRRLDLHQTDTANALYSIQGDVAKLTSIMANMSSTLARQRPDPPLEPPKVTRFATPPPLQNHSLSPITEQITPNSAHHLAQTPPPFPPHFGKFRPDQLPLPPSPSPIPESCSQTYTQPTTTTTAPIITIPHYTQQINPQTQPQYYLPPNNSQAQHPSTSYQPPQQSPPTPPPQEQNNHTHHHNSYEPHIRAPHVEIPLFHGENPRAWLLECEDLFNLVKI
jgi:hypothetical protein